MEKKDRGVEKKWRADGDLEREGERKSIGIDKKVKEIGSSARDFG